jgi:hypothetical protein
MAIESNYGSRYLVSKSELPQLMKSIESMTSEIQYTKSTDKKVYFNSQAHELYFGQTVRASNYGISSPSVEFRFSPFELWTLEQKSILYTKSDVIKHSQKESYGIEEIKSMLRGQTKFDGVSLSEPLRPFIATTANRRNFVFKNDGRFKITMDTFTKCFAFVDDSVAKQVGAEDFARIELKRFGYAGECDSTVLKIYDEMLNSAKAMPVVSKRDAGYNMLSAYLMCAADWRTHTTDTEIEAKLSVSAHNQNLFNLIKNDFAYGRILGFALIDKFSYILERAMMNTYLITEDNRYARVSAKGDHRVLTTKEDNEIMDDPYGLGCIIKRKEVETALLPSTANEKEVTLYKKTKEFWVRSNQSHNRYHISIDGSFPINSSVASLYQIEIESTMNNPTSSEVAIATMEIAGITKQITDMHKGLTPTTQTKQEWLSSLMRSK